MLPLVLSLLTADTFGLDVYKARRKALMDTIKTGAALITQDMAWDGNRNGMDFYYLTGIEEEGAALLLQPQAPEDMREILLLSKHDPEMEVWSGHRLALPSVELEKRTGFKHIYRMPAVAHLLVGACARWKSLVFVSDFTAAPEPKPKAMELYAAAQERTYDCAVRDMHGAVAKMRIVKTPAEMVLLRKAIEMTAAGHKAALKAVKSGAREYEIKDAIEDAFRKSGSRHVAYDSIVGSGPNGAVLHYPKDDRQARAGEVVVIDAGAEAEYYAADITRTYPVGGKFTPEQRKVYDVVLKAQAAAIAKAKAGVTVAQIDQAARDVILAAGYYDAFPHGTSHFVGLEVHDAGDYHAPLPVGAVITVEPGVYLPSLGFGVRIEDEILITATGSENLSKAIPKDADEIEKLMAN